MISALFHVIRAVSISEISITIFLGSNKHKTAFLNGVLDEDEYIYFPQNIS